MQQVLETTAFICWIIDAILMIFLIPELKHEWVFYHVSPVVSVLGIYAVWLQYIPFHRKKLKVTDETSTVYINLNKIQATPITLIQEEQRWCFTVSCGEFKHTFRYASRFDAEKVIERLVTI